LIKSLPKRIHIIGSVGSGKTTLARELSSKFGVPFFELDNVVWKRHESGDIRRTDEEKQEYLNHILASNSWIIEGVHHEDWVSTSFQHAEVIIFLNTKSSVRIYRIIKRFILQKLGVEKSNYQPTLKMFFKMFKWNKYFEEVGKPNIFKKFEVYSNKLVIVTNKDDLENLFVSKFKKKADF
jgi:adenylate kinase family enzyme